MKKTFCILLTAGLILSSCSSGRKRRSANAVPLPVSQKIELKQAAVEIPYVYEGYKNRNPFQPLKGSPAAMSGSKELISADGKEEILDSFVVTGVMITAEGSRVALLRGADSQPYVLKNKVLYDPDGNGVPGVTGTVLPDKVILIKDKKTATFSLPE